jgi:glyoxylase-like metal-dependent hydrolase (beta-lactamase superfamily II)/ferredoxin
MARHDLRLAQNAAGEFFVDSSCIDCDTCRWIAPAVFARAEEIEQSFVSRQPDQDDRERALMALVACPTASIGTVNKMDARPAARRFPELVEENIYYCGFTSERSYGASSYLIVRPEGNVLVDSPRAATPLLRRIEEMGGVKLMFLSHRDDVADHARLHDYFGCERVIHRLEPVDAERKLDGRDPVELADGLLAIPLPGHTRGSTALLYREKFLFSGDHLWWSENLGALNASRSVCWYSWAEQTRSMARLLDFRFEWVLPGHGRRYHAPSAAVMRSELEQLVERMARTQ